MGFIEDKIKKTLEMLEKSICLKEEPLAGFLYRPTEYKKGNDLPTIGAGWAEFKEEGRWGGDKDTHYWFYKKIKTQSECLLTIKTGLEGKWDALNPQFIVYIDGVLTQGLDVNHTQVLLCGKTEYEIYLYAYTGMHAAFLDFVPSLVYINKDCEKLYYDIKVPYDICLYLDPFGKEYIDTMGYLEKTVNLIDFRSVGAQDFFDSVKNALLFIEAGFYKKRGGQSDVTAVCIGHTHIDVAWLWTLAQTREKVLRSFSTVVNLMKQYPEYKFMSSQAQLYQYLKEECPALYEEIKTLVAQGRWETEGAMWVEADCNLSGGESLIRQILFGKRFFKQEFGKDNEILWLPDVFGYSAALPQILKKSGINKFVTSKISWNETNKMPYDTFNWQGIDGTEILTYFLTAQDKKRGKEPVNFTTYNAKITPAQVAGTWERYQNKELNDEVLVTFGHGDGGGGPTREMLEVGRRLSFGIKGCPKVRIDTAASFLKRLDEKTKNNPRLPKWVGELYLELHRGTYTSIAKNKKNNRKSEFLYQNIELLCGMDMVLNNAAYPQEKINAGWETILLNQFHDIIPGSSIKAVYDDSDIQYAQIQKAAREIADKTYDSIAKNINTGGGLLVFNPHSFENSGIAELDGEAVYVENIPPKGYRAVASKPRQSTVTVQKDQLENKFFKVLLKDGNIVRIYDKLNKRDVIKKGRKANVLQAFEDIPRGWDAWEISDYYKDKVWEITDVAGIREITEGARAGLEITRKFLSSTIIQKIYLYDNIGRIDFDTKIDWHEEHILLKALFPVDVHAQTATYDIQFGNVSRPTHANTSWDTAKFEVCAHKFADVSEDGYGVSLLNDCKYGYDISGSDMRITLLKCAAYPNPEADKGEHQFVYSLYPHKGNFKQGKTVQAAYALNLPMTAKRIGKQEGTLPESYSLIRCDSENIIVETIKKAEDSDSLVIRLFDCYNRRTKAKLVFGFDAKEVFLCDMMENDIKNVKVRDNSVSLEVKPFEIVTLKVKVK